MNKVDVRDVLRRAADVGDVHGRDLFANEARAAKLAFADLVAAAESRGLFLDAYFKASQSSQPGDWMEAALLAKQWECRISEALAKVKP